MADPLTALMYAVQVMNLLKNLIIRTLKERKESVIDSVPVSRLEPSDENGHQSSSQLNPEENEDEADINNGEEKAFVAVEPSAESPPHPSDVNSVDESGSENLLTAIENIIPDGSRPLVDNCPCEVTIGLQESGLSSSSHTGSSNLKKLNERTTIWSASAGEKSKGGGIVSRINSRTELFEAWR